MGLLYQFARLPEQQQLNWTVGVSFGIMAIGEIIYEFMTIPRQRRLVNWIEYIGPHFLLYWEWFQQQRHRLNEAADKMARCYQHSSDDPLHKYEDVGIGYRCRHCSLFIWAGEEFWVPGEFSSGRSLP